MAKINNEIYKYGKIRVTEFKKIDLKSALQIALYCVDPIKLDLFIFSDLAHTCMQSNGHIVSFKCTSKKTCVVLCNYQKVPGFLYLKSFVILSIFFIHTNLQIIFISN